MSDTRRITLHVNGKLHTADVETRVHLADFLRQSLGYTGTHLGCEHGVCGACTIIVNGRAVRSCLMLAVQAPQTPCSQPRCVPVYPSDWRRKSAK